MDFYETNQDQKYALEVKSKLKLGKPFRIVEIGDRTKLTDNFVTIITIYFEAKKSKHSPNEYSKWQSKMIKSIRNDVPLVVFIDEKSSIRFIQKCKEHNLTAIFYITDSIWNVVNELELLRNRTYIDVYLLEQKKMDNDPEKNLHHQDLYGIWNMKNYLTYKTVQLNPFNSEFFLFTDSGAWRGKQFTEWPDIKFVKKVSSKINDKMLYGQVHNTNENGEFRVTNNVIQGTFFAGSKKAIKSIYRDYYELHDKMIDNGLYVGKEQNIMNILTFYRSYNKIVRLNTNHLNCSIWYNQWFFYQYYFAKQEDYICFKDKLSLIIN